MTRDRSRERAAAQMYANRTVSRQLLQEHQAVYEAIKRQDPGAAQDEMRRHLFHVEQVLIRYLKK